MRIAVRRTLIAGTIGAVLLGGGLGTAAIASTGSDDPAPSTGTRSATGQGTDRSDDRDDRAEADAARKARLSVQNVIDAAGAKVPGTVTELEFESEDGGPQWEVEIAGRDGKSHEVRVDDRTGKATIEKADTHDADDSDDPDDSDD